MKFVILLVFLGLQLIEGRCPTIAYEKDNYRWVFPRRDVGPRYNIIENIQALNKKVHLNMNTYLELYKATTDKQVEISSNPLRISRFANNAITEVYTHAVTEKIFDLVEPIYQLFNISKIVSDEVGNATMYSILQYKMFSKQVKDHTDYEKLWFENAFTDLFVETESNVEPYWETKSGIKSCGSFSFAEGFKIAEELYVEYERCASVEMNKTDEGFQKFFKELTNFEKEVHEGLYVAPMKCVQQRLKKDPNACLKRLHRQNFAKMVQKDEIREAALTTKTESLKRVNTCASAATKKSLKSLRHVYQQFILCFLADHKKKETSIKGINKFLLFMFEIPDLVCPAVKGAKAHCSTCGGK